MTHLKIFLLLIVCALSVLDGKAQTGIALARISEYILLLSVLYYVAYRYKRRNHLVK